jgi:hypothetical protein
MPSSSKKRNEIHSLEQTVPGGGVKSTNYPDHPRPLFGLDHPTFQPSIKGNGGSMRALPLSAALLSLVLLGACGSYNVTYDYDVTATFPPK